MHNEEIKHNFQIVRFLSKKEIIITINSKTAQYKKCTTMLYMLFRKDMNITIFMTVVPQVRYMILCDYTVAL